MKKPVLGILGGGQLARMLAEAAFRHGVGVSVFADHPHSSASHLAPNIFVGSLTQVDLLSRFLAEVSLVVFESEFVDCDHLEQAAAGLAVKFAPSLATMRRLRSKLSQKEILAELAIPTSEYSVIDSKFGIENQIQRVLKHFGGKAVFKWSELGYDGLGVLEIVDETNKELISGFCQRARERGAKILAEKRINFERELAIVAVRGQDGEFANYPLVVSEQWMGICHRVYGPAVACEVAPHMQTQAIDYARRIAEHLNIVGAFALELFETRDGSLLVNEIAPRVHNSGHYTQDAAHTSQFENHIRAALGLPLGDTATTPAFAMVNLLGPRGVHSPEAEGFLPKPTRNLHLHWYNKAAFRPQRKLGHLNGAVDDAARLPDLLNELKQCEQNWLGRMVTLIKEELK